jgi:hypothetical protein
MANKKKLWGMLVMALALGMVLVGCQTEPEETVTWTPEYAIDDTGPGGGKIFYVSEAGFAVEGLGTCHYLEAAPEDISEGKAWASPAFLPAYGNVDDNPNDYIGGTGDWTDIPGTETGIGAGKKNTRLILEPDADAPAALACVQYSSNGKSDWFLPGKDELNELYRNRSNVGVLGDKYWSSSQSYPDWGQGSDRFSGAWLQMFSNGNQDDGYLKKNELQVRAVRAF